jgi:hypothetical protein
MPQYQDIFGQQQTECLNLIEVNILLKITSIGGHVPFLPWV